MAERVGSPQAAAQVFARFAAAEEPVAPTYARISRAIAADVELHSLLLEAPTGQRLPVLLLGAIHDLVLREPDSVLRPWYPSVSGQVPSAADPSTALRSFVAARRDEIVELLRTRRVQTNEVNRSAAWRLGLGLLSTRDPRPLHLLELGPAAGLNLIPDLYGCQIHSPAGSLQVGPTAAPLMLQVDDPTGSFRAPTDWTIGAPVVARVGIDEHPLDIDDEADTRWLQACIWPEQPERFRALEAALTLLRTEPLAVPLDIRRGEMVSGVGPLLAEVGPDTHAVVLSSWVLAYVARPQRAALLAALEDAARALADRGSRVSLLSLEAATTLDWVPVPDLPAGAPADLVNASVLALTEFPADTDGAGAGATGVSGRDGDTARATVTSHARVIARCHAHMRWLRPT